jgi:hypothetical protein
MRRANTGVLGLAVAVATVLASVAGASSDVPPRGKRALLHWLETGIYRERFVGEPEVHPSTAEGRVHGLNVRTYYDPILVDDLRAGRGTFRKGAAMVKELYFDSVDRPMGYSAMIKVRQRSGVSGRGWLFYETLDGTDRAVSFGRRLGVCTGCHQSGVDFLRSGFRP